eukprot:XP_001609883.1 hypothetical protein [Babesia bovis T2Bo]
MENGTVEIYSYPSLVKITEFSLPSKVVHLHLLDGHLNDLGKKMYANNAQIHPELYPELDGSSWNTPGRYLCCISTCGQCVVVDLDKVVKPDTQESVEPKDNDDSVQANDGCIPKAELTIDAAVVTYELRKPITAVCYHTLLRNRIFIGGPDKAPLLFDLYSGKVLWTGKNPHPSLLDLKTHLDVQSMCILEVLGPNVVAVSTSNSYVYLYDIRSQCKPVCEINVCEERSQGLSARIMASCNMKEYNTDRRREIQQSVPKNFTASDRNIIKVTNLPRPYQVEEDIKPKDIAYFIAGDNCGRIYKIRVTTGETLLETVKQMLSRYPSIPKNLSKEGINDYIINARKVFGSASANDTPLHCAPREHNQYFCEMERNYLSHTGAATDIVCTGNYVVSVGLSRYLVIGKYKSFKDCFRMYCNQKLTCILVPTSELYRDYSEDELPMLDIPPIKRQKIATGLKRDIKEDSDQDEITEDTSHIDDDDVSDNELDSGTSSDSNPGDTDDLEDESKDDGSSDEDAYSDTESIDDSPDTD